MLYIRFLESKNDKRKRKETKIKIYFCSFEELPVRQCHPHDCPCRFVDEYHKLLPALLQLVGAEAPVTPVAEDDDPNVVLLALDDVAVLLDDLLPQVPHPPRDGKSQSGIQDSVA